MSQREEISSDVSKPSSDFDHAVEAERSLSEIVLKAERIILPGKGLGNLYVSRDMDCPTDEVLESQEAVAADLKKLEDAFGQYENDFAANILIASGHINKLFKDVEKAQDPWEHLVNDCIPEMLTYSKVIEGTEFYEAFMQHRGRLNPPEESASLTAALIKTARTELLDLVNQYDVQEGGSGEYTEIPFFVLDLMQINSFSSFGAVQKAVRKARELVKNGHSAAFSVFSTFTEIADGQSQAERIQEVNTARSEFLKLLLSEREVPQGPVIVAGSLVSVPSVKHIPEEFLAGVVSKDFGNVSHVVSVCGDLDIPILQLSSLHLEVLEEFATSETILIDGDAGEIVINPSSSRLATYYRNLVRVTNEEPISASTSDGLEVQLDLTISNASRPVLERVQSLGVGVGLVRTELVIDSPEVSDDEQVAIYKQILEASFEPVDIRTFDLTNDKAGLRTSRSKKTSEPMHSNMLDTDLVRQLKSIIRAAWECDKEPRIFFPQIQSAREMQEYVNLVYEQALPELGIRTQDLLDLPTIRLGAQVESLGGIANLGDILASVAPAIDFLVIGSTDLGNDVGHQLGGREGALRAKDDVDFYTPHLFRSLKEAVDTVAQVAPEIPLRICGALAQSGEFFPVLRGIGFTRFGPDINAAKALEQAISTCSVADCKELALDVLDARDSEEVKERLSRFMAARLS